MSHKSAEPHESWGASLLPCPQADTAVGSASRLTAALAACRDLLVASSVHALLLHFFASSHLLLILQTLSAPFCIFHSAPPLSYHPLLFSPSPLISHPQDEVPFILSFFHAFSCYRALSPPSYAPASLDCPSFFSPTLLPLWHSALCVVSFLNLFTLRCCSRLPMLQGNINYVSLSCLTKSILNSLVKCIYDTELKGSRNRLAGYRAELE